MKKAFFAFISVAFIIAAVFIFLYKFDHPFTTTMLSLSKDQSQVIDGITITNKRVYTMTPIYLDGAEGPGQPRVVLELNDNGTISEIDLSLYNPENKYGAQTTNGHVFKLLSADVKNNSVELSIEPEQ